jgi:NTE family protein
VSLLRELDPYLVKRRVGAAVNLLELTGLATDIGFLRTVRRTAFPLPYVDRPERISANVFPPLREDPIPALADAKIGVVASGGSGAAVALVGAVRAFEEAGVRPQRISACSGGAIWGSMWAAGLSASEMARFSLSWRPEEYLDVQWWRAPWFALSALRGFTGLAKGEAIQRLFDARLWDLRADELEIPLETITYNMDLGRLEYFGPRATPALSVGELVRTAIALPLFIEAVEVGGHLYVDGGIVDAFPAKPFAEDESFEHVFGLNFLFPAGLEPPDMTGWQDRALGIFQATRQLEQGYQLELARRGADSLGDRLTLVDMVEPDALHGVAFYELFLDRRRWPELMRGGYERTRRVLDGFRTRERAGATAQRARSDSARAGG